VQLLAVIVADGKIEKRQSRGAGNEARLQKRPGNGKLIDRFFSFARNMRRAIRKSASGTEAERGFRAVRRIGDGEFHDVAAERIRISGHDEKQLQRVVGPQPVGGSVRSTEHVVLDLDREIEILPVIKKAGGCAQVAVALHRGAVVGKRLRRAEANRNGGGVFAEIPVDHDRPHRLRHR